MNRVAVVGVTDAGAGSLSAEALRFIDGAALLCGGARHLAFFPDHPAERFVVKANVDDLVARLARESRPAVVLASGDPCCFGIGPVLAARLGPERVHIIPNASAVQLAFARLGLPWQDAAILSAHGRDLAPILPRALTAAMAAILTDGHNTPAVIAAALLDAGGGDATVDVFEHLGGPLERHVSGTLREVAGMAFAPLNVLILSRDPAPSRPLFGYPDDAFAHDRGQVTKAEVRAVALAKLRLHDHGVTWDVGAGCGSVGIEAALIAPASSVFAVERDERQASLAYRNRCSFRAWNLDLLTGEAPEALASLPDPDSVFIGGTGGRLAEVVAVSVERLRPGGRVVVNLATIEHLHAVTSFARERGWDCDVVQLQVARGAPIAGLTRLAPLNPVWIVTLSVPGATP